MLHDAENNPLPRWRWPRAAYVHIPFCAHHCGYCDFAIATGQDQRIDQYLDALTAELASRVRDGSLDDRRDDVLTAVRDSVRAKLLVSNPDYVGDHVG